MDIALHNEKFTEFILGRKTEEQDNKVKINDELHLHQRREMNWSSYVIGVNGDITGLFQPGYFEATTACSKYTNELSTAACSKSLKTSRFFTLIIPSFITRDMVTGVRTP
jgi:hypothetical protein